MARFLVDDGLPVALEEDDDGAAVASPLAVARLKGFRDTIVLVVHSELTLQEIWLMKVAFYFMTQNPRATSHFWA